MSIASIVERYQSEPFVWGRTDCCQFVGECLRETTGQDFAQYFDVDGEEEVRELVEDAGDLVALMSSVFGDPLERAARNGDAVMVRQGNVQILGFVWNNTVLLRTPAGLVDWPLDKVETVWCLK